MIGPVLANATKLAAYESKPIDSPVPVLELVLPVMLIPPPLVFFSEAGPMKIPTEPAVALELPIKVMASAAVLVDAMLTIAVLIW